MWWKFEMKRLWHHSGYVMIYGDISVWQSGDSAYRMRSICVDKSKADKVLLLKQKYSGNTPIVRNGH